MTTPPLSAALVQALVVDDEALEQLAAALAPHLVVVAPAITGPLTTGQAAERAGLHERTIRRALAAGTLAGRTVAGRWRIELDDLAAWLEVGAPTSATPAMHNGRPPRGATAGADAIAGRRAA